MRKRSLLGLLTLLVFTFVFAFLLSLAASAGGYLLHLIVPLGLFQAGALFCAAVLIVITGMGLLTISESIEKRHWDYASDEAEGDGDFDEDVEEEETPTDEPSHQSDSSDAIPRYRRNRPCPCGSGKKYKKCCFNRESESADDVIHF